MSEERVKLLRGIAFGDDPAISPRDRLDALARLEPLTPARDPIAELVALTDDELERQWDAYFGREVVERALADDQNLPCTAEAIRFAVERRAAELADIKRLEAEVERRAQARAAELYLDEGWRSLRLTLDSAPLTAAEGTESAEATKELLDDSEAGEWPRTPLMAFPDELSPRRRKRRL